MEEQQDTPAGNPGTRFAVIAAVLVTVMVTVALVATLTRGGTAPETPVGEPSADVAPPPPPAGESARPSYPVAPTIDPEVDAWYQKSLPSLLRIISVLATPPTEDVGILRLRCVQIEGDVDGLLRAGKAPKDDLAEAVDLWVRAIDEGVRYCNTASRDVPDDEAIINTSLAFASTVPTFEGVVETLAAYGIGFGQ